MTERRNIASEVKWESTVGYSRAVRVGNRIVVSGTAAVDGAGNVIAPGDAYRQTREALQRVRAALEQAGAGLEHVIRTRIYVTDITRWEEIGRAHGELFAKIRPATSMVEVRRLIDPEMLVEIEAEAEV